ncbi:hypothetical protein V8E53_000437 [Lactarius tabidus]
MSQNVENTTLTFQQAYNLAYDAALHRYPPDASNKEEDQAPLDVIDGSKEIFTMYMEMSLREDKEMVEGWKEDTNIILIFVSSPLPVP